MKYSTECMTVLQHLALLQESYKILPYNPDFPLTSHRCIDFLNHILVAFCVFLYHSLSNKCPIVSMVPRYLKIKREKYLKPVKQKMNESFKEYVNFISDKMFAEVNFECKIPFHHFSLLAGVNETRSTYLSLFFEETLVLMIYPSCQ